MHVKSYALCNNNNNNTNTTTKKKKKKKKIKKKKTNDNNNNSLYFQRVTHLAKQSIFHETIKQVFGIKLEFTIDHQNDYR